ncbi:NADPH-dependent ferric-chelate reductase [Baekduia alba]|uniref:siderophore-interacting protein n=1 Tax=Baekduia alba TaxID=2997333 RepID=UPI00233FBC0F|nr:siderophore-interacting protein [Baekduia alba]WCB95233.1 NADPH-dependent ferric-chelate reductase [Baekduia alba]
MPTVDRVRHALRVRLLEVASVADLTPRLRRVVLRGDLDGFASAAPDDHVKLLFPRPGEQRPVLPELGPNGLSRGPDAPPARDYTPRAFDVAAGTLTVDMVVHGDGPAATWAAAARPGSRVGQVGPRGSRVASDDFDWWLLAADETGLPALARRLEELPPAARAIVLVEVDGPADELALRTDADVRLAWLHRDGAEPGTTTLLEDAVRDLALPVGEGFAWVAGEADAARRLRTHLRDERGLPKAYTKVTGYWRLGAADHHDPPEDGA